MSHSFAGRGFIECLGPRWHEGSCRARVVETVNAPNPCRQCRVPTRNSIGRSGGRQPRVRRVPNRAPGRPWPSHRGGPVARPTGAAHTTARSVAEDDVRGRESPRESQSGGAPFVVVVQAADLGDLDDPASARGLGRARDRGVLVEREMGTPDVIAGEIALEVTAKAALVPDDQVVGTLSAQGARSGVDIRIRQAYGGLRAKQQ